MTEATKQLIRKTFDTHVKAIDDHTFEAMISTESVDRDGDVLLAAGARLDSFRRNPIVLFGHNYFEASAVVGKALDVESIPGKGVRTLFEFAGADVSEDADMVRRLWAGGFLNATSVGFIPKNWDRRKGDNGEDLDRGLVFTEWELLEFSIVPVPANQDALRLAMKALETRKLVFTDAKDGHELSFIDVIRPAETEQPSDEFSEDELDAALGGLQTAISSYAEVLR